MINIKDANGNYVVIKDNDLMVALMEHDFKLLGMSVEVISRLRQDYMEKAGMMPMTIENVDAFFSRPIREFRVRGYKDDCDA